MNDRDRYVEEQLQQLIFAAEAGMHELAGQHAANLTALLLDKASSDAADTASGEQQAATDGGPPIVFETLRAFLKRALPRAEALVGQVRGGTNLLPRYGWLMPWGREGSTKTSWLVDLLFHAAEGLDWLGYLIARELRIVAVVNEGVPGGLQDKLALKTELWPGDIDKVLDHLGVYASPWGEFSLGNERMARHLRDFARDFEADYVALDPLHTMGTTGAGAPQETEAFKHVLRRNGLWDDVGFITPHHSNQRGMVSGDWARHPDTVVHLEKDGRRPATKMTLQKARPADPGELGVPVILEWITDTIGYRRVAVDAAAKTGDDNREHVLAAVKEGLRSASQVAERTALTAKTVGRHFKRLEQDGRIRLEDGPNRTRLATPAGPPDDANDDDEQETLL